MVIDKEIELQGYLSIGIILELPILQTYFYVILD